MTWKKNDLNFLVFFFWGVGGSRLGINPKFADSVREEEPVFENLLGFRGTCHHMAGRMSKKVMENLGRFKRLAPFLSSSASSSFKTCQIWITPWGWDLALKYVRPSTAWTRPYVDGKEQFWALLGFEGPASWGQLPKAGPEKLGQAENLFLAFC